MFLVLAGYGSYACCLPLLRAFGKDWVMPWAERKFLRMIGKVEHFCV